MKVLRLVCLNSFLLLVSLLVRVVSTSLMAFVRFSFPCISWLEYKRFLPCFAGHPCTCHARIYSDSAELRAEDGE